MVQCLGEKANVQRQIHAQNHEGNDEYQIKETYGEVLSCDASSSGRSKYLR